MVTALSPTTCTQVCSRCEAVAVNECWWDDHLLGVLLPFPLIVHHDITQGNSEFRTPYVF